MGLGGKTALVYNINIINYRFLLRREIMDDFMEGCPACESWDKEHPNMILENEFARAFASDSFREGHCIVSVKRHMISPSGMKSPWSSCCS